jgi:hypothetical protein
VVSKSGINFCFGGAEALSSVSTFESQAEGAGVVFCDWLSSVENVAEKVQSRLDEILTEAV